MGKRVLVISTYKIECGIAAFTDTLETLLSDPFDVTVYPLDQNLLRRCSARKGDAFIRKMVAEAQKYDVINLQWEPGTLGSSDYNSYRRLKMILKGCPNMILTVHTPPNQHMQLQIAPGIAKILKGRVFKGLSLISHNFRAWNSSRHATRYIRQASRRLGDKFHVVLHTKRERLFFEQQMGLIHVHDHPLSCIRKGWDQSIAVDGANYKKELQGSFGADTVFIGFFGFISRYKGLLTVIQAMRHLPANYRLLVFGGIHPGAIKEWQELDPYIEEVLGLITNKPKRQKKSLLSRLSPEESSSMPTAEIEGLTDRVAFMGAPDDYEFAKAIMACDVCVFPYLEVGQSGSGPVSQAIDLGRPTLLSRTLAFLELKKYFPDNFDFFDVGNYVHLAQLIGRTVENAPKKEYKHPYSNLTLRDFYSAIIERVSP